MLRRKRLYLTVSALLALVALSVGMIAATSAGAHGPGGRRFEVTITNITKGQIFSPAVVATHNRRFGTLFELGAPASAELAAVAEDAITGPLMELLAANPNVADVQLLTGAGGPIMPGESASVIVDPMGRAPNISLVGMLVTTNDAFYAVNGVRGPAAGMETYLSAAYDAGSEGNNEDCAYIPGPPCGNAEVRDTESAEGYVYVHSGIHGSGDLDPALHDWRNPVAKITIRRVR